MRLDLRRIVAVGLLATGLTACSTSTGTINTPIGKVQLGMYVEEVEEILGSGIVVGSDISDGLYIVETRAYPSGDGRTYIVYYVNEVVRRWELKDQASTASQAQ